MIASIDELSSHVAAHAGVSAALAERVTRVVLAGFGGYLSPARRQLIAEELPPPLGAVILTGSDLATPLEERVLPLTTSVGHARELIASVCHVLGEELSSESVDALRAAVPSELSHLLEVAAEAEQRPARTRARDTLATGRPGSRHSVSDAKGPGAQSESIAADNPHAATKLSSSTGSTQERHHETMAEGRPGYPDPLAGRRG